MTITILVYKLIVRHWEARLSVVLPMDNHLVLRQVLIYAVLLARPVAPAQTKIYIPGHAQTHQIQAAKTASPALRQILVLAVW